MVQEAIADPTYVLGCTDAEAERLILQSRIFDRITRRFLADAGIGAGMTVLDIGSGSGDVAFAAADLVGPTGHVTGIDLNSAIIEKAQSRARAEGRDNLTFVAGDCRTALHDECFDAAVGRFVLMYTGDVTATLQAVAERVKPGGVVAFAEADFNTALDYEQAGSDGLNRTAWEWVNRAFACGGVPTTMAGLLYRAYIAAGLRAPVMALQAPLCGAEEQIGFEWFATSLRSMSPMLEQYGIVSAETLDLETFVPRSRASVADSGLPLILLPVVTAWTRKPTSD